MRSPFPAAAPDARFARRVYFDLWGLPPTPAQLETFLHDHEPGKRARLIDALLADSPPYAEHWISWWNDLLRNDQGGEYAGERKSITDWLLGALEHNLPYDKMIAALVNPVERTDPDGFLIGVNWRGDINASQTPYMQAAQNTAQIFLGINLKCASCHDSFINRYKLRESYGMAALFAPQSRLELVRCDVKTGKYTGPQLLYPELGAVPEDAPLAAAARRRGAILHRCRGTAAWPAPSSIATGKNYSDAAWWNRWTKWMASRGMPTCSTGWHPTSPRMAAI